MCPGKPNIELNEQRPKLIDFGLQMIVKDLKLAIKPGNLLKMPIGFLAVGLSERTLVSWLKGTPESKAKNQTYVGVPVVLTLLGRPCSVKGVVEGLSNGLNI